MTNQKNVSLLDQLEKVRNANLRIIIQSHYLIQIGSLVYLAAYFAEATYGPTCDDVPPCSGIDSSLIIWAPLRIIPPLSNPSAQPLLNPETYFKKYNNLSRLEIRKRKREI